MNHEHTEVLAGTLKDTIREYLTDINDPEHLQHLYRVAVRLAANESDAREAGMKRETCKLLLDGVEDENQLERLYWAIIKAIYGEA